MKVTLTTDDGEVIEMWTEVKVERYIYLIGINSGGDPSSIDEDLIELVIRREENER